MRIIALAVATILGVGTSFGEPIRPRDLAEGKVLPDSVSPDQRFVILEVHHGSSTQTSIVITPSDRSKYLTIIPIYSEWTTDRSHKVRTTTKWNSTSSLVAVHDSISKHSKLHVFHVTDPDTKRLVVPDLLKQCATALGVNAESSRSSGQLPTQWIDPATLEVTVRLKTPMGRSLSKKCRLTISEAG
jgi:hypothetical protein